MNAQIRPTPQDESSVPQIYAALVKVMKAIGTAGISKDRKNDQQGYKFRGIDDCYNALNPLLANAGVLVMPRVLKREITERQTKSGGVLFYVVLDMEFDFIAAEDASMHTVRVVGEAMDSADKASNKAMSAGFKYACMEVFCIPTEGDNDADKTTHEVQPTGAVDVDEAKELAFDMMQAMEGDVSEEVKALQVLDLHERVAHLHDLYTAASTQLRAADKTAWKKYVRMGIEMKRNETKIAAAGRKDF